LDAFRLPGWYLDAVAQAIWFDLKAASTEMAALQTHGSSFAASLEGGYPVRVWGNLVIEPQAQLVYQRLALADASDAASGVFFHNADSLPGRLGAELRNTWNPGWDFGAMAGLTRPATNQVPNQVTTWFRADLWHEFVANPTVAFSSEVGPVPFSSDLRQTWADLRVGATHHQCRPVHERRLRCQPSQSQLRLRRQGRLQDRVVKGAAPSPEVSCVLSAFPWPVAVLPMRLNQLEGWLIRSDPSHRNFVR
jgi:hypothetical protein